MHKLKGLDENPTITTAFNIFDVPFKGQMIDFWDVGGSEINWPINRHYMTYTDVVLWCCNS